ncbi:lytic transglycosylase [Vibrio rumoiensis]|uniref:Lytic transglycosylase n=1 Tax=Vibrio rumoiensis 1S-45 TaxID=1188252 RepID=A0A1E5E0K9_9VIBR|nr:LysM peptidoglycan-binding domain-containing protein [Vibrio rumoiensis]OEF23959.1 lytic transglycosylase [Vibrio rumoiensis 1S-45]
MTSKYIWVLALLLAGCQNTPTSTESKTDGSEATQTVSVTPEVAPVPKVAPTKSVKKPITRSKPAELTPQQQENLWDRISMQFKLEVPDDPQVDYYRTWYLKHPEHLKTVSERAAPFLYMITTRIEERNLPLELALLPVVESSFDPFAYSYGGGSAAGLWQFMPVTAERFGLERNYWYDGRRDVSASTDAALDYMSLLGQRFDGSWDNAIAAYNSGGGRVSSAIRKNKKAGKPTDFFSLDLPKETRQYVPKLLALADVIANSKAYGIEIPTIANKPVLTSVNPKEQLDLTIAAQYAGISVKELQSYNPGFKKWATSPTGPYSFLIPIDKAEHFEQQATKNRGKGIKLIRYKVKAGDTLSVIARNNQTTSQVIQKANGLKSTNIRIGQLLMVPKSAQQNPSYGRSSNTRLAKSTPSNKAKSSYTVRSGDSLWSIAKKNHISTNTLASWNSMSSKDSLRIGQKLVIWTDSKNSSTLRTVFYNVRSGDTVGAIAQKFKVKTADVLSWNDLSHKDYLKPGQKLKLYINESETNA